MLAYGVHDLQEGGVLGGLNTLAFDVSGQVPPSSWYGTLLKGTINFSPQTTVLQAIVWVAYIVPVMYLFLRGGSGSRPTARAREEQPESSTPRAAPHLVRAVVLAGVVALAGCGSGEKPAKSGAVGVTASDSACKSTTGDVASGNRTFSVKNDGSQITEVYVYGTGDRVMGEVENIGPATSRDLVVQLPPGKYQIACKPGMTGDGIRTALAVSGKAVAQPANAQLQTAVANYRRYVQSETKTLVDLTIPFAAAVKANDIPKAKRLYATARVHYERIEPIAESFPKLDTAIDIRADGVTKGEPWTGFHRLERDLWQRGDISNDGPLADRLVRDCKKLRATVATVKITPDELGNGARALMDEVAKGKVTGEEERYSHTDLVDFQGNLDGAKTAYAELRPIVAARKPAAGDHARHAIRGPPAPALYARAGLDLQVVHSTQTGRGPCARRSRRRRRRAAVRRHGGRVAVSDGRLSRRRLLQVAAGGTALGATAVVARTTSGSESASERPSDAGVPFYGPHQAGITTPVQDRLHFAAFDVLEGTSRAQLADLLRTWTAAAADMTAGREIGGAAGSSDQYAPPRDTGEALALPPARLTVTAGFGPSLFDARFGLGRRRPAALEPLPEVRGRRARPGAQRR